MLLRFEDRARYTHPDLLQSVKDKFEALFNHPVEEVADEPDVDLDFTPDVVSVHTCRFPEVTKCSCRKRVPYLEALKMARNGDADWVRLITATGNQIVPALSLRTHDRVRRAWVPNSGTSELVAEVALAKKQNRAPDVAGLVEQADAIQNAAQNQDISFTEGCDIGGTIQSVNKTAIADSGKKLVEENRGTFDESTFPKMTGPKMQYQGKKRVRQADKTDKVGHEVADGD
jgi:hypothetical protein